VLLVLSHLPGARGQDPRDNRTGNHLGIARWAIPSDNGTHTANRIGGGCPCPKKAEGTYTDEGTWGWDYQGNWFKRRTLLGWWHGRRYQGGAGAYKTDGPQLKPQGQ
ncbi:MAG: hypothetical protein ACREDX_09575, partial [Aestuariivirga sp.]